MLDFADGTQVVVAKRVDGGRGVYSGAFVTMRPYTATGTDTAVVSASDAGGEAVSVTKLVVVQ